jgi:phage baseplate assembly protein gpV
MYNFYRMENGNLRQDDLGKENERAGHIRVYLSPQLGERNT